MNEIDLDIADYRTILGHKGRISGYHDVVKIDNCKEKITSKLLDDLKLAKGVLINVSVNKESMIQQANEVASFIKDILSDDCESICNITEDSNIKIDEVRYEILISGLNDLCQKKKQ